MSNVSAFAPLRGDADAGTQAEPQAAEAFGNEVSPS
jgi:hypothetical protein